MTNTTPASRYFTIVCRGWTKEGLARQIDRAIHPVPPEDIISIGYMDQPLYLLGRRNSAIVTVRTTEGVDAFTT